MSFINPIEIEISLSAAAQSAPVFRLLIMGQGSGCDPGKDNKPGYMGK